MKRLICDACGGSLEIESNQKVLLCPFCGAKFIEKTVTNNYSIIGGQINANEITINTDVLAKDSKTSAAEGHNRLGNFKVAYEILQELVVLFPEDVRIRVALFDSISFNRTKIDYNRKEFEELRKQYRIIEKYDHKKAIELERFYSYASNVIIGKQNYISAQIAQCNEIQEKADKKKRTGTFFLICFVISLTLLFFSPILSLALAFVFLYAWFVWKELFKKYTYSINQKSEEISQLINELESEELRFIVKS